MPKVSACVILFNPKPSYAKLVQEYIGSVDEVIVIDNSPNASVVEFSARKIHHPQNVGVAAALNEASGIALANGAEWLLTMDQDGRMPPASLEKMVAHLDSLGNVAILAPAFNPQEQGTEELKEVDMAMTSGSLINLRVWKALGGFNESFFIDEVDHEYCLRARKKGFRVLRCPRVVIPHTPGEKRIARGLRRKFEFAWHPPERIYYMARNLILLEDLHGERFPGAIAARKVELERLIYQHLRFCPHRVRTWRLIKRARRDGLAKRGGKLA